MKRFAAAFLAAALSSAGPAGAQVLDLSTVKCRDFLTTNKESIGVILAFMHAYYKDEDAPPTIDFDKLGKDAERLGASCARNPDLSLMTVADKLFE